MKLRWLVLALVACDGVQPPSNTQDEWDGKLAARVIDYSAALRIASLRLTGELPTLAELRAVGNAGGDAQRTAYEAQIRTYMAGPRFARQMFYFWQDALKLGDDPRLDSAPAFVAQLATTDRSFLDVFRASSGTCPTFDPATGVFTPGDCGNTPTTVGLLTHPGMMTQYFSNFGFRRVRWLQETFACTRFPAEVATVATDVGGLAPYTGEFPFESIAGFATGGHVNFRDTSSVICANCHSNLNHIAPLFGHYDEGGQYHADLVVPTPFPDAPPAVAGDYLPAGEPLAWRHDKPIADMTGLGAAMADDPDVSACVIARMWSWALGKPELVDSETHVPPATIEAQIAAFTTNNHQLRAALFGIFTSDDFVRF